MTAPFLLDTHAHLDADIYARDLDIVVNHALAENIWIVTVGHDYDSSRRAVEIASRYPAGVFAAVGLHPLKIKGDVAADDKLIDLAKFHALASHPKVVAIGETGLDFHDLPEGARNRSQLQAGARVKENQKKVFGKFLQLSRELRLPLMLHCRDAHDEMLPMLETWDKMSPGFDARGIVHCFSGGWKEARRYFNLEFMISFTGIVTHGHYQTEVIKRSPLSRMVLESDCPYLTPVAWSMRRNEPSYLTSVAAAIAGIRGTTLDEVATQTTKNGLKMFPKMMRG